MERNDTELRSQMQQHFADFEFEVPGNDLWPEIESKLESKKRNSFLWYSIAGAAAIFIVGFTSGWLLSSDTDVQSVADNHYKSSQTIKQNYSNVSENVNTDSDLYGEEQANLNSEQKDKAEVNKISPNAMETTKIDVQQNPIKNNNVSSNPTNSKNDSKQPQPDEQKIKQSSMDTQRSLASMNPSDVEESDLVPSLNNSNKKDSDYLTKVTMVSDSEPAKENSIRPIHDLFAENVTSEEQDSTATLSKNELSANPNSDKENNKATKKEDKHGRWRLMATAGIGNLSTIDRTNGSYPTASAFTIGGTAKQDITQDNNQYGVTNAVPDYNQLTYEVPVDINVLMQRRIGKRFGLETGISMNIVKSKYTVGSQTNSPRLTYLTLPLGVSYDIIQARNTCIEGFGQYRMGKVVHSVYRNGDFEQVYTTNTVNVQSYKPYTAGLNQSIAIGIGINQRLSDKIGLNLRAAASTFHQIDQQEEYVRSIQDIWPEVHIGATYKI